MWHNLFLLLFNFFERVPPWVHYLVFWFIIYCKLVKAVQHFFITILGVTLVAATGYKRHRDVNIFINQRGYVDLVITFTQRDDLIILINFLFTKLGYLLLAYVKRLRIW